MIDGVCEILRWGKRRGPSCAHSDSILQYTNPTFKRRIWWMFPSFSLPVRCCLSCRNDPILRGTWAEHDREAFCYWAALSHSRRSNIETKACRPSAGRGLICLALRHGLAEPCVWPQSTSQFSAVWEREHFLFTGGRAETLQETAFIGKTTCWKWYTTKAIWTPASPHLSVLQSCRSSAAAGFFFATVAEC